MALSSNQIELNTVSTNQNALLEECANQKPSWASLSLLTTSHLLGTNIRSFNNSPRLNVTKIQLLKIVWKIEKIFTYFQNSQIFLLEIVRLAVPFHICQIQRNLHVSNPVFSGWWPGPDRPGLPGLLTDKWPISRAWNIPEVDVVKTIRMKIISTSADTWWCCSGWCWRHIGNICDFIGRGIVTSEIPFDRPLQYDQSYGYCRYHEQALNFNSPTIFEPG